MKPSEITAGFSNAMDMSDFIPARVELDDNQLPIYQHECISCGGNMFRLIVCFENYEVSMYYTEMECISCNTIQKAPTPIDHPAFVKE